MLHLLGHSVSMISPINGDQLKYWPKSNANLNLVPFLWQYVSNMDIGSLHSLHASGTMLNSCLCASYCCSIVPYYDDNAMYMLYYYIYYLCIVKLAVIITSASAYIHNKCHLLLTCGWLQYVCFIVPASHSSPIINITTSPFF